MFERLINVFPYFKEKAERRDVEQVNALPENIRSTFIHGTEEEALLAIDAIETRERLQGTKLIGPAALELLQDLRAFAEQSKNNK